MEPDQTGRLSSGTLLFKNKGYKDFKWNNGRGILKEGIILERETLQEKNISDFQWIGLLKGQMITWKSQSNVSRQKNDAITRKIKVQHPNGRCLAPK